MILYNTQNFNLNLSYARKKLELDSNMLRIRLVPEFLISWVDKKYGAYIQETQGFVFIAYWLFWEFRIEKNHRSDFRDTKEKS